MESGERTLNTENQSMKQEGRLSIAEGSSGRQGGSGRSGGRLISLLAALAAAFFLALFAPHAGIESEAAQTGIDVSSYQGAIDWKQVKNAGITFAMVRCGNTLYGIDSYFGYNMSSAAAAGIRTGVYCYTFAQNPAQAVADANLVVNACANYTVSFPIAIDFEDKSLIGVSPSDQAAIVNAFCSVIYSAGYTPMVYTSRNWFVERMGPVSWDKWVAQYNSVCDYPGPVAMWQYSSHGSVAGISGRVDMDSCIKDYFSSIIATGWDHRNNNTYYYQNYKRVTGMQTIDGKMYYFDPNSQACYTGWLNNGQNRLYYFDPAQNGAALIGWGNIEGTMYYFGSDGLAVIGGQVIEGQHYLFAADGKMYTGWYQDGANLTYYSPMNGQMLFGWQTIDGALYYLNPNTGAVTTGLVPINGAVYYFGTDGRMQTGVATIGADTYYFGTDGKMQTGLQTIAGSVYYFGTDGKMQKGLVPVGGSVYYFAPDGRMQTGLVVIGKDKYFFGTNGALEIGWHNIGGGWFYFGPDGKLVTNQVFYDNAGIPVQVDANGMMVYPAGYTPR